MEKLVIAEGISLKPLRQLLGSVDINLKISPVISKQLNLEVPVHPWVAADTYRLYKDLSKLFLAVLSVIQIGIGINSWLECGTAFKMNGLQLPHTTQDSHKNFMGVKISLHHQDGLNDYVCTISEMEFSAPCAHSWWRCFFQPGRKLAGRHPTVLWCGCWLPGKIYFEKVTPQPVLVICVYFIM